MKSAGEVDAVTRTARRNVPSGPDGTGTKYSDVVPEKPPAWIDPVDPIVPSGRELPAYVPLDTKHTGRRRMAGPGKAGWAILGVLSAAGAVALYLTTTGEEPRTAGSNTEVISTARLEEKGKDTSQVDRARASSPRHWVEPTWNVTSESDGKANVIPPENQIPQTLNWKRLVNRGDHLASMGDMASARLVYRLAALDGSARAAAALGSTYDPIYLEARGTQGIQADPAKAITWYKKAIGMGERSAETRLRKLKTRLQSTPAVGDPGA